MADYKGTYNPDKKRGELLKDNASTGDYFPDKKGIFKDTSGLDLAKERAEELNNPKKGVLQTLKDKVMGTDAQNKAAEEREKARAEANPESNEAKFRKAVGKAKGGMIKSSASKRADGCAIRGKTRA